MYEWLLEKRYALSKQNGLDINVSDTPRATNSMRSPATALDGRFRPCAGRNEAGSDERERRARAWPAAIQPPARIQTSLSARLIVLRFNSWGGSANFCAARSWHRGFKG
jgi:hypothetical protein